MSVKPPLRSFASLLWTCESLLFWWQQSSGQNFCALKCSLFLEQVVFLSVLLSIPLEGSVSFSPFHPAGERSLLLSIAASPKLSLPFFLWVSAFQVHYSSVPACRLPALGLVALAARLAFLLKLPQLAAADPDGSRFSWQWRSNAFSLILSVGRIADLLHLLFLRPFKKRCPQGICVARCPLLWG